MNDAPNVALADFKRSKIVATVGPATSSYDSILNLIKAGANAIRLNFGFEEDRASQIKWIRQAGQEYGKPIAIIQDLQGPKLRLGDFEGVIAVQKGQSLVFRYRADYEKEKIIPLGHDFSSKVKRGERILLYDGKLEAVITSVKDSVIYARSANEGILIARKGINLPDSDFAGDILTKKDNKDIIFGVGQGVDYIALSFVQSANDIKNLRRRLANLNSDIKIIAKIETKAAVNNLEEIVEEADGTMVARGDLAIELGQEKVPIIQRKIVGLGLKYAKPSIVATQMLASMSESPTPTRAEVSDVATAVLIGSDGLMLSDETAVGKNAIETVKTMKEIIRYTEENAPSKEIYPDYKDEKLTCQDAICKATIKLANSLHATAIVAETKSGATALKICSWRPKQPVIVVTSNQRVAQQLSILYGAMTFVRPDGQMQATKLTDWLRTQRIFKKGDVIVTVSGKHPGVVGATDTIKVRSL
jgi:pyruvate kinase